MAASWHTPALKSLAVPVVCVLICFLAYSSQYLFYHLDPTPLTAKEALCFNILVAATCCSYERACRADPGRLPKAISQAGLERKYPSDGSANAHTPARRADEAVERQRWCKKCEAVKPPRAHHCRQCARCIPKMDHHCPWTSNCVSHNTFPHFLRFVYYACASLSLLAYFLSVRLYALWETRNLPAYLGPSIWALFHLFALALITTLLLIALSILLVTTTHSLMANTTMIESWEIERHEALVQKARYLGGYVHGPGGCRVRIKHQEFPYDIGIWKNLIQGMGSSSIASWILPFGGGPSNELGWGPWEENGFEDPGTTWPPIDPDKLPRAPPTQDDASWGRNAFIHSDGNEVQAFRQRQMQDYKRLEKAQGNATSVSAIDRGEEKRRLANRSSDKGKYRDEDEYESEIDYEEGMDGEPGWTNSDGDRLRDYGVDSEAEEEDIKESEDILLNDGDEDIPLGELMRLRRREGGFIPDSKIPVDDHLR